MSLKSSGTLRNKVTEDRESRVFHSLETYDRDRLERLQKTTCV